MLGRPGIPLSLAALFLLAPLSGAGVPGVALVGGVADDALLCDEGTPAAGGCVQWSGSWPSGHEWWAAVELMAWDAHGRAYGISGGEGSAITGGFVRAIDVATRTLEWERSIHEGCVVEGSPCDPRKMVPEDVVVSEDGQLVLVASRFDGLLAYHVTVVAYDAATGAPLWSASNGLSPDGVDSTALTIDDDRGIAVVTGLTEGGSSHWVYDTEWARALDLATGATLWTEVLDVGADPTSPKAYWSARSTVDEETGVVYTNGFVATARNVTTGQLLWHRVLPDANGRATQGTDIALDPTTGHLLAVVAEGSAGRGILRALDPATGAILWTTDTMDSGPEALVLDDHGRAYVIEQGRVAAVDAASGELLWVASHHLAGGPRQTLEFRGLAGDVNGPGDVLYVATVLGVAAMDADSGALLWEQGLGYTAGVSLSPDGSSLYSLGGEYEEIDLHALAPGIGFVSEGLRHGP